MIGRSSILILLFLTMLPTVISMPSVAGTVTSATIHGTVRSSAAGNPPIQGIYVFIWRRDGGYSVWVKTDANGYYSKAVQDTGHSGFNICANKNDPNNPGYNSGYSTLEIPNVYLDNAQNGYVVVDFQLTPTNQPPPGATSDLYGLCINANAGDQSTQNPPDFELDDLKVKWVRTIKYEGRDVLHHGNVKWLVVFNGESIRRAGGESWSTYVARFSDTVKQIVSNNKWISAIEVWNEEDLADPPGQTGRYLTAQEYGQLLKATYEKVKSLSNPPLVIFGGLGSGAGNGADYVNKVKQQWGGMIFFDALGFHPYLATVDGIGKSDWGTMEGNINTVYDVAARRQIWLTEFGIFYQYNGIGRSLQAQYLEKCYKLFAKLKDANKMKVGVAFWFAWDDRTHRDYNTQSFGLVEQIWESNLNNPERWRRPAWDAYRRVASSGVVFSDGFESGISKWTTYRANICRSSQHRSGTYSLEVHTTGPAYTVKDGKTVSGGAFTWPFIYTGVRGPRTYEVSLYAYVPYSTSIEVMLYVQQYRGPTYDTKITKSSDSFAYDYYYAKTISSQNAWVKLTVRFTSHQDARYISVSLSLNQNDKSCYFDDIVVKET